MTLRRIPRVLSVAALIAMAVMVGAMSASGTPPTAGVELPTPLAGTTAAWTGDATYVFGGADGSGQVDQILRIADGEVATMSPTIPGGAEGATALWTGSEVILFVRSHIYHYDVANDALTSVAMHTDSGNYRAAVWTGEVAYLFGLTGVFSYDPATYTVTNLGGDHHDHSMAGQTAIWDGSFAYIFGGWGGEQFCNQILRFEPATGHFEEVGTLPSPRGYMSSIWTGGKAYVFGGFGQGFSRLAEIVVFDPAQMSVESSHERLPTGRGMTSAVWADDHALILGGSAAGSQDLPDVLRYEPGLAHRSGTIDSVDLIIDAMPPDGPIGFVVGASRDDFYCIDWQPADGAPQEILCVDEATLPVPIPSVAVPLVSIGPEHVASTPELAWTIGGAYTYDAAKITPLASVLGQDPVYRPYPAGEDAWFLENGADLGMTLEIWARDGGVLVHHEAVVIPWLGQLMATAAMND